MHKGGVRADLQPKIPVFQHGQGFIKATALQGHQTACKQHTVDRKNIRKNQPLTLVRAVIAQHFLPLGIDHLGVGVRSMHTGLRLQGVHQLINMPRRKDVVVVQKNAVLTLCML